MKNAKDKSIDSKSVFLRDTKYNDYIYKGVNSTSKCGLKCSEMDEVITSDKFEKWKKMNKKARFTWLNSFRSKNKKNIQFAEKMVICQRHRYILLNRKGNITMTPKITKQNSPFLKWAGGKYKLINALKELMPSTIGGRYIEPFVGAGSLALNITADSVSINDINPDLVLLWKTVKSNVEDLIVECRELFSDKYMNETSYYKFREEFNTTAIGLRRAALFIYLNRHCFNGLCRYNSSGKFNVPVGSYKVVGLPEAELRQASEIIKNWSITSIDFRKVMENLKSGDVCYCDPPYVPINKISNFSDYSKEGFNDKDHIDLANAAREAANKGAIVIISNHNTEFTRRIYETERGAVIHLKEVSRTIASKSKNRKCASELMAVFKKLKD